MPQQDSSTYWKKNRVETRAAGFDPDRAVKASAIVTIASAYTNAHRCNNRVRTITDLLVELIAEKGGQAAQAALPCLSCDRLQHVERPQPPAEQALHAAVVVALHEQVVVRGPARGRARRAAEVRRPRIGRGDRVASGDERRRREVAGGARGVTRDERARAQRGAVVGERDRAGRRPARGRAPGDRPAGRRRPAPRCGCAAGGAGPRGGRW